MTESISKDGYNSDGGPQEIKAQAKANSEGALSEVVIVDGSLYGTVNTQSVIGLAGTRQELTFDPPIKGMSIDISFGVAAGSGSKDDNYALFCIGASNDAVADAWLDEANTAPRLKIKPVDGVQNIYFNGATVSRVDLIGVGATVDLDVSIGGVS